MLNTGLEGCRQEDAKRGRADQSQDVARVVDDIEIPAEGPFPYLGGDSLIGLDELGTTDRPPAAP